MKLLSRRDFLRLGGLALGGLAFTSFLPDITEFEDVDLVRVATKSVTVYAEPNDQSQKVSTWYRDDLVHVYDEITSQTPSYNPVWYRVWGGYMHRARLQKVRVNYNIPLTTIPETGLLGEVTVPFAQAYRYDKWNGWQVTYRLYYSTVHWLAGVDPGPDGQTWYRILDEADGSLYFVPAVQMRPIPSEELAPISPQVPFEQKRIEVVLSKQALSCFEYDQVVFRTMVSTGLEGLSIDESTATPAGQFNIQNKMPSKHMGDANLAAGIDDYVLPGVPWDSFFTTLGHAFHGTYWHDNFGVPMSHGCVNMRTEDAKWLFRWSMPSASFEEINKKTHDRIGFGTQVNIKN